jgi:hypothetical protein
MITQEATFDLADRKHANKESDSTLEALQRMHDDIEAIRSADNTVGAEMNKIRIVCDPPPITPPCHPVEEPADPLVVKAAVQEINCADRKLQDELDALRPAASTGSRRFEQDLAAFQKQVQGFSTEIVRLNGLTQIKDLEEKSYDKQEITSETDKIEKLAKGAEKTLERLKKDLSH